MWRYTAGEVDNDAAHEVKYGWCGWKWYCSWGEIWLSRLRMIQVMRWDWAVGAENYKCYEVRYGSWGWEWYSSCGEIWLVRLRMILLMWLEMAGEVENDTAYVVRYGWWGREKKCYRSCGETWQVRLRWSCSCWESLLKGLILILLMWWDMAVWFIIIFL